MAGTNGWKPARACTCTRDGVGTWASPMMCWEEGQYLEYTAISRRIYMYATV